MQRSDIFKNSGPTVFPAAWSWLMDEVLPDFVKKRYSPREAWKDKPFSQQDAIFFSKGIEELSEIFTEERDRKIFNYLQHPRFRSAYLLYFLPLQGAKFETLFNLYPKPLKSALDHGKKEGMLRVLDLGSGPGTGSISFLLWLLSTEGEVPPIELTWYDTNRQIMEDGKALVEHLSSRFPKLRGRVTVKTHVAPWTTAAAASAEASLILVGHVLNESSSGRIHPHEALLKILAQNKNGGGSVLIEPATRHSAQDLAEIRKKWIEAQGGAKTNNAKLIWGPCLHGGACPLAEGRDWCHFSVPTEVPGKWFRAFSKALGSERHWVKFSYLWLASTKDPAETSPAGFRRVISDPIGEIVLLCEPETARRFPNPRQRPLRRGELIKIRMK